MSILSAGTFFGSLTAGDLADYIGRKWTIIMGCFIYMVVEYCLHDLLPLANEAYTSCRRRFADCVYWSQSPCRWSIDRWHWCWVRVCYCHPLHVGDLSSQGQKRSGLWSPVLHYTRHPYRIMRQLCSSRPQRHWLVQDPDRHSVSLAATYVLKSLSVLDTKQYNIYISLYLLWMWMRQFR